MKVKSFRIMGIRCFEDTQEIGLSPSLNIFIGKNNAGKSTIIKGLLAWQAPQFNQADVRKGLHISGHSITLTEFDVDPHLLARTEVRGGNYSCHRQFHGSMPQTENCPSLRVDGEVTVFYRSRPNNFIEPFSARRKATAFDQRINAELQNVVDGTFSTLYSRIDLLSRGHPKHDMFWDAMNNVVGLPITTKASQGGKEAGYYFDDDVFISLERMGDGVTEMIALIAELCVQRGKLFLLEEPESNLHPKGLKSLLSLVREASAHNQFVVTTHSNIVLRELGAEPEARVFQIYREQENGPNSPSIVEEVHQGHQARTAVLRELGYEFSDFNMFDAWIFLEESSAEQILNDILIPLFAPTLRGRIRTFSCNGVDNVQATVSEFRRLVTFVHLQPIYEGRLWVRTDGDSPGIRVATELRAAFRMLTEETCRPFSREQFEYYYPLHFQDRVAAVLDLKDRPRRQGKATLLQEVLAWSRGSEAEVRGAWLASAIEPIELLNAIAQSLQHDGRATARIADPNPEGITEKLE